MKKIKISGVYKEFEDLTELTKEENFLLSKASESIENAYAPYSGYKVGAAVLLENNKIFTGNNQENAAYPSGLCAERVALFYAASQFPETPVKAIAITADSLKFTIDKPVPPCGACRQVMAENENRVNKPIKLILKGKTGKIFVINGISNLLPLTFQADGLKNKYESYGTHINKNM